jgi:hypothetical protein
VKLLSPALKEAFAESKLLFGEFSSILICGIVVFTLSTWSSLTLLIPIQVTTVVIFFALRSERLNILESGRIFARFFFLGSLISMTMTVFLPLNKVYPIMVSLFFSFEFITIYWLLTYLELRRIL